MGNIVVLKKKKKNEGNRKSENGYAVRKDLGNINFKTAHDYFGVPTQLTQQSGGLGKLSQRTHLNGSSVDMSFAISAWIYSLQRCHEK